MAQQMRGRSASCGRKKARDKTALSAAESTRPLRILLLLLALAIVPNVLNGFSSAYVKRLKTQNIMLAAQKPAAAFAAADKNRFMALPARLAAGEAAAGMAAEDMAALETISGSRVLPRGAAAKEAGARETRFGKNSPDLSNLAPQPEGAAESAPVFAYKIDRPLFASSAVIVLLHGSGADETSLMPFARSVWPRATLIGLRGRIMQGAERRWYHKITPTEFDGREAAREADALAQFMASLAEKHNYAPDSMIFVGYSNGANLLAVLAMKYPQLVRRAVLLRPMPVLSAPPQNNRQNQRILALSGARDTLYGGYAEQLYAELRQNGAKAVSYRIPATHMPCREDGKLITRWLRLGY